MNSLAAKPRLAACCCNDIAKFRLLAIPALSLDSLDTRSQVHFCGRHLARQIPIEAVVHEALGLSDAIQMGLPDKLTIRKDVDGLTEAPPKFDNIRPGDSSFAEDRYHRGLCALKVLHMEKVSVFLNFKKVACNSHSGVDA